MKPILLSLLAVALLAACGVKPSNVKPPEGAKGIYPRTYPAPEAEDIK